LGNTNDDGAGFAYDWTRQKQQQTLDAKAKKKTLKKRIDKLSGKNRNLKRR
jgi:hypothetical protein